MPPAARLALENLATAGHVPGAKFVETGTCWGMFNLREQDTAAIDQIYAEALAS